jgi:hypothetical protein
LTKSKRIEELLLGQQERAANRYFCVRHGVVTLSGPSSVLPINVNSSKCSK